MKKLSTLSILILLVILSSCSTNSYIKLDSNYIEYENVKYNETGFSKIYEEELNNNLVVIGYSYSLIFGRKAFYGNSLNNPEIVIDSFDNIYVREDINYFDFNFNLLNSPYNNEQTEKNVVATASLNEILDEEHFKYEVEMWDEYYIGTIYLEGHYIVDYYEELAILVIDNNYYLRLRDELYKVQDDYVETLKSYISLVNISL